jgi:hypothetical protein
MVHDEDGLVEGWLSTKVPGHPSLIYHPVPQTPGVDVRVATAADDRVPLSGGEGSFAAYAARP